MPERSVKRQYRLVRYCEQRPEKWTSYTRRTRTYKIQGKEFNLYILEKTLLALKNTSVTKVSLKVKGRQLYITSEGFKFEYKLGEQKC